MIFDSSEQQYNPGRNPNSRIDEPERIENIESLENNNFLLSDDHRINLNRRLPLGFCLMPVKDYQRLNHYRKDPKGIEIEYVPGDREDRGEIMDPVASAIQQVWAATQRKNADEKKVVRTVPQSYQGRSRQMEKIKNIIQRFRKYGKYPILSTHFNKVGLMQALNEVESQNKRGLLNIDTFRERMNLILETGKQTTYETNIVAVIDEMLEELQCYCEQARKVEFQKNIESIQKSIDKITRFVTEPTETGKSTGIVYAKKKRKSERLEPYSDIEIIYICDLINKLPPAYLIGLWEIAEEKPFCETTQSCIQIQMRELSNPKKIREIELYVKGKHSLLLRSRERKREKLLEMRGKKYNVDEGNENNQNLQGKQKLENNSVYEAQRKGEDQEEQPSPLFRPLMDYPAPQNNNEYEFDGFLNKEDELQMPELVIPSLGKDPSKQDDMHKGLETPKFKGLTNYKVKDYDLDMPVYNQDQERGEEQDSSDSSMITDQDESDF